MSEGEGMHFSYFFLPFRYVGDDYDTFRYRLDADIWEIKPYIFRDDRNSSALADEEKKYSSWGSSFYGHVNDLMDTESFYYTLKKDSFGCLGNDIVINADGEFLDTPYRVCEASLIHFSSGIGMVIYKVEVTDDDADEYTVAEMCYHLKKPENMYFGAPDERVSLIAVVRSLFPKDISSKIKFLHQYTDASQGQVNFMSFSYSDDRPGHFTTDQNQLRRMYMARYGYDARYVHPAGYEYDDYAEILALVDYINFGITPGGIACLAYGCAEEGQGGHRAYIEGSFVKEFCTKYLYMNIVLLHQRYLLCADLKDFEKNPDRAVLHRFRAGFNIRDISEIMDYQRLYVKAYRQLDIEGLLKEAEDRLPEDDGGVRSLEEVNERTNATLAVILTLGFFTAFADMMVMFGYINGNDRKYLWLVVLFSVLIFGTAAVTAAYMRRSFARILEDVKNTKDLPRFIGILIAIFALIIIFAAKWPVFK